MNRRCMPGDVLNHHAEHRREIGRASISERSRKRFIVLMHKPFRELINVGKQFISHRLRIPDSIDWDRHLGRSDGLSRNFASEASYHRSRMHSKDFYDVPQVPGSGARAPGITQIGPAVFFDHLIDRFPRLNNCGAQQPNRNAKVVSIDDVSLV